MKSAQTELDQARERLKGIQAASARDLAEMKAALEAPDKKR